MISKLLFLILAAFNSAIAFAGDTRVLHAGTVELDSGIFSTTLSPGSLSGNTAFTLPTSNGTNGQVLQTNGSGALSWATGVPTATTINTTAPLAGGGDLSTNRTFSIALATTATDGYLAYTDWNIFNNKVSTTRAINVTAPLTGGGDLSADRTIAITQSTTSTDGYLSSTDWNTFNGKLTSPMTTLGDITYENATPAAARLAGNTTSTKNFLSQTGTGTISAAPVWSTIAVGDVPSLPASKITSGQLAVAQGGTALASGTSGGILGYTASGTLASSAALTANGVVIGGGAGATPTAVANNATATNEFLTQSSSGTPAWAALLAADIPNLDASKITTGTLATARGGTGVSGSATFPSSGTVVTEAATETLTNKTLGSTNTLTGSVIASFTPNGTNTLTAPAATDTLVGKATTDTLTNKTLTSPTVTGESSTAIAALGLRDTSAAFDVTLAATSSTTATAGRTITLDTQNTSKTLKTVPLSNFSTLADGSSGQVLSTQGSGAGYTWASALTSSLNTNNINVGNGSNVATAVDTTTGTAGGRILARQGTFTATVTIASPGVFTATAHGLANGDAIFLTTTGALPTGLSANTTYFVVATSANTFELASTYGGTAINTSGSQSGTHTVNYSGISPKPLSIGDADIAAAAAISGSKLQTVTASNAGVLSTGSDTVAGLKTFNSGISFGGNTLNHYDEGTWTFSSGTTSGTATLSGGSGITGSTLLWRRVGNVVFVSAVSVSFSSAMTVTGAGTLNVTLTGVSGLPSYTSKTSIGGGVVFNLGSNSNGGAVSASTLGGTDVQLVVYCPVTGIWSASSLNFWYTL